MRELVSIATTTVLVIHLFSWPTDANAQESPAKKSIGQAKSVTQAAKAGEGAARQAFRQFATRPDLHYVADLKYTLPNGEERVLYVVPQNDASEFPVKGLFFYTPALALAETENPIDGYPSVVQDAELQSDGSTLLWFRVLLSSKEVTQHALDAVLKQREARAWWTEKGLIENDITIKPWPVIHAMIALVDVRKPGTPISVTQTEVRSGSFAEFGFQLTNEELSEFRDIARKGRLGLIYSYSFIGKGQDYGVINLSAVKNLRVSLESMLSSKQLKGEAPIFQGEANEAARNTALMISQTAITNNPDTLALVNTPSLMQHLFARDGDISLENLKTVDAETVKRVADYLMPRVEQLRQSIKAEQASKKTDDTTDFKVTKDDTSANIGAGIMVYGVGINFGIGNTAECSKGKELKNRLETATGTEWQVQKDTSKLIPHRIFKYKFIQGSDQTIIKDRSAVYIAVDKENYYYQEKAIGLKFTEKMLGKLEPVRGATLASYDGIPLGAMIPFFGVKPPKGYRWCNGNDSKDYPKLDNVFPHADWVPTRLVGMPMPDMREQMLGGSKDEGGVGQEFKAGKLTVSGHTVPGSAFTVSHTYIRRPLEGPDDKNVSVLLTPQEATWSVLGFSPRVPQPPIRDDRNPLVLTPAKATVKVAVPAENCAGSHDIPQVTLGLNSASTNPRHIMCRWIMRVE